MSKKKILVTVPNDWWINKFVVMKLLEIQADNRYFKAISLPRMEPPLENFQHNAIKILLEDGYDYWLSIDDDNAPLRNPLDLVELDKDVIGLPTPVWHQTDNPEEYPIRYNMYDYEPDKDTYKEHWPKKGLQRVDAVGGGCFLTARRIYEHPEMQKGAHARKLHPDGRTKRSNDISFSERAKDCGFELWAHYDYPCMHFKEIELNTVMKAFRNFYGRKDQKPA